MKTLIVNAIIEGLTAKKDRSLGVRFSTPELTSEEKTEFFNLQNQNVEMTIKPLEEKAPEEIKISTDLENKSQSIRIRNVLYILWKKETEGIEFEEYYRKHTEKIIDWLKSKIDL